MKIRLAVPHTVIIRSYAVHMYKPAPFIYSVGTIAALVAFHSISFPHLAHARFQAQLCAPHGGSSHFIFLLSRKPGEDTRYSGCLSHEYVDALTADGFRTHHTALELHSPKKGFSLPVLGQTSKPFVLALQFAQMNSFLP